MTYSIVNSIIKELEQKVQKLSAENKQLKAENKKLKDKIESMGVVMSDLESRDRNLSNSLSYISGGE